MRNTATTHQSIAPGRSTFNNTCPTEWYPPILDNILGAPAVWHITLDLAWTPVRWVRTVWKETS